MSNYRYLTYEDRKKIKRLLDTRASDNQIAIACDTHCSTITREIERGLVNGVYDPDVAQATVEANMSRRGKKKRGV